MNKLQLQLKNIKDRAVAYAMNFTWNRKFHKLVKKYGGGKHIPPEELAKLGTLDLDDMTVKSIRMAGVMDKIFTILQVDIFTTKSQYIFSHYLNAKLTDPADLVSIEELYDTAKSGQDLLDWIVKNGDVTERKIEFLISSAERKLEWRALLDKKLYRG